jgi:hypothetical protein
MNADNSALEQTAIPSRSWQGFSRRRARCGAGQERSGSPLLTAGVRLIGNSIAVLRWPILLTVVAFASCFGSSCAPKAASAPPLVMLDQDEVGIHVSAACDSILSILMRTPGATVNDFPPEWEPPCCTVSISGVVQDLRGHPNPFDTLQEDLSPRGWAFSFGVRPPNVEFWVLTRADVRCDVIASWPSHRNGDSTGYSVFVSCTPRARWPGEETRR